MEYKTPPKKDPWKTNQKQNAFKKETYEKVIELSDRI